MRLRGLGRLRQSLSVERDTRLEARLKGVERALGALDKRLRATEQNAARQVGTLDYAGATLTIGITSRMELLSRVRPVHKEPWTVEWIEQSFGSGDVLWDIGANVGAYSLIAASLAGEGSRVVAVEPASANYAALCDNVAQNGFGEIVTALPVALADSTRLDVLSISDASAGAAIHTVEGVATPELRASHRQAAICFALDDLIERFDVPWPTLIKLDVDGAEAAVLAGASRALSRPELRSVLVEVDRRLTDEVVAALEGADFVLSRRIDDRDGKPMPNIWYGVFERVAAR